MNKPLKKINREIELIDGTKGKFIEKEIQPWSERWKYVIEITYPKERKGEIIRAYWHQVINPERFK